MKTAKTKHAQKNTEHSNVEHPKKHRVKHLKIGLILSIITVIASGAVVASLYITGKETTGSSSSATQQLEDALSNTLATSKQKTVQSKKGFAFRYNPDIVKVVGYTLEDEAAPTSYTKPEELAKPKDYVVFSMYAKAYVEEDLKAYKIPSELTLTTSKHDDFFEKRKKDYGNNISNIDATIRWFTPLPTSDTNQITEDSRSQVTINGVTYTQIVYKNIETKYLKTTSYTYALYTVQNNRPYAFRITNNDNPDQNLIAPLHDVIRSAAFFAPGETLKQTAAASNTSAAAGDPLSTTSNVPNELKEDTVVTVAARNQPAVVRIGAIRCGTVELLVAGRVHSSYPDACGAGVGSGSIISADGYIATNGHVALLGINEGILVRAITDLKLGKPETIRSYLDYLVSGGVMSVADRDELVRKITQKDQEALNQLLKSVESIPLENIRQVGIKNNYNIQLSDSPIKYDVKEDGVIAFIGSTNVVSAEYVASDYDGDDGVLNFNNGNSQGSDVALLKMSGNHYPVVKLGSLSNVSKGTIITAIGYPAFVDGGLDTKKTRTVPSITQGEVVELGYDSPEKVRKVVSMTTPISGGNSGGPAFAPDGTQVGLNTYGDQGTCGTGECFSTIAYFRDVQDLKNVVSKNSISLNDQSEFQKNWDQGIVLFAAGKYGKSIPYFEKAQKAYPSSHLATALLKVAEENNTTNGFVIIGIGVLLLGSVASGGFFFMLTRRNKQILAYQTQAPLPYPNQQQLYAQPQQQYAPTYVAQQPQQSPYQQPQATYAPQAQQQAVPQQQYYQQPANPAGYAAQPQTQAPQQPAAPVNQPQLSYPTQQPQVIRPTQQQPPIDGQNNNPQIQ